jgi:uncharacterized glyoxalase superfamily protein PhnB
MTLLPHNHGMWAVIGVYAGREDNIFWRRRINDGRGEVEAAGARSLGPGEVQPLGRDVIHSVTNPTSSFTGAIHLYGGDFFSTARSEWDPEALRERPYDVERNLGLFEESNALRAMRERSGETTRSRTGIQATHHVLAVNDLRTTTAYFRDVLGFSDDGIEADGWAFLSRGAFAVMLGECPSEVPASETNNHSYFAHVMVDDVDALHADYRAKGAIFAADISDRPWGLREFCVRTPEGHRIVFAQRTGA